LFTLFTFLVAAAFVLVWLAYMRAMVLVHPRRSHPKRTPGDLGVTSWEEVRFPSADGLQLAGWFLSPDPDGDGATLICVHGLGSNRGELLKEAVMFSKHGYGALLLDLRNHGESEGTVTTLGYAEVEDVRGAVTYLLTRREVNPGRIGVIGPSMGGAVAIRAAARDERIRAAVAQSTYSSLEENIQGGFRAFTGLPAFPFAPLVIWFGRYETGLDLRQVRPIDDVARIAPRGILLIHGVRDGGIHVDNAVRLFEAASEPKELYLIAEGGHGGLYAVEPAEYERRVTDFLDTYLRGH
jgi:fermentation-respiration switch protein FrsA (DUF1100 family)